MTHVELWPDIKSLIAGQKEVLKDAKSKGYEYTMPNESNLWFTSRKTWTSYKKQQDSQGVMVWWMVPVWRQISEKSEQNCTIEIHSARYDRKTEELIPQPKLQ
jgi:hypothetical protein